MKEIAILTCARVPQLTPSDQLLVNDLHTKGVKSTSVVWTDDAWDPTAYDLLLVRSVWDYHLMHEAWMDFLDRMKQASIQVLNPISVLAWNSNKKYLKEVLDEQNQVALKIVERGSFLDLRKWMEAQNWKKVVVKPTVSASGYKTWTCEVEQASRYQNDLDALLAERDVIIQEFAPEVVEQGEWSLVFFNKTYSHSVLKRVKPGDFRVQSDYGGTVEILQPPTKAVSTAQQILVDIPEEICYARVDGIMRGEDFYLMELELIEPELFVSLIPGSEQRFGDAILAYLNKT